MAVRLVEDQPLHCTFLCFVLSKLSQSIEFLSLPHLYTAGNRGRIVFLGPFFKAYSLEELKGWTCYRCP